METNFLEHSRIVKKRSDRSQANIRIETILHEYSPNFATCISLHTTSPPIIEPDSITIHSSTHSKTLSQGVTHDDRNRPIPKCPSPRRGISQTKPISQPSRLVYPLRCVLHRGYSLSLFVTLSAVFRRVSAGTDFTDGDRGEFQAVSKWRKGEIAWKMISFSRWWGWFRKIWLNLEDVLWLGFFFGEMGRGRRNLCSSKGKQALRGNRIWGCWGIDSRVFEGRNMVLSEEFWRKFWKMNNFWC